MDHRVLNSILIDNLLFVIICNSKNFDKLHFSIKIVYEQQQQQQQFLHYYYRPKQNSTIIQQ